MASEGSQAKFAMEPLAGTFDTSSTRFEILRETIVQQTELIDSNGEATRGTRSHAKERVNQGLKRVFGSVWFHPSPAELDFLLPRIFGAVESSDVFNLAETTPTFGIMVDRVAKVFTYSGCYVTRAIFSGSEGKRLLLRLDIVGTSESISAAGTFPAISVDLDTAYVFQQGVLTLESSTRSFKDFVLVVDNFQDVKFYNSQTATSIDSQDRKIYLQATTPYTSSEVDLYATPEGSSAGAAGSLVFTNGNQSLDFTFANLKAFAKSPVVPGKKEILLPVRYKAYKSGTTDELIITSDASA